MHVAEAAFHTSRSEPDRRADPAAEQESTGHEAMIDFVAAVSHELRTPMTAVLGAAKTLLRDDVDLSADCSRQLLEMIVTQATRLSLDPPRW